MKLNVKDLTGKKTGFVSLPGAIFGVTKANPTLVAQAVRVALSNARQGTKKAKRRGEVEGTGRKIWRQKGTGKARHGDRQAPLFVGGGVAHGPKGNENYKLNLPDKMKRLALRIVLTDKLKDERIVLVKSLKTVKAKTAELVKVLTKVADYKPGNKLTLVVDADEAGVRLAARNLESIRLESPMSLNTYNVLRGGKLVISQEALSKLIDRLKS